MDVERMLVTRSLKKTRNPGLTWGDASGWIGKRTALFGISNVDQEGMNSRMWPLKIMHFFLLNEISYFGCTLCPEEVQLINTVVILQKNAMHKLVNIFNNYFLK
jgi:hypothetical protein